MARIYDNIESKFVQGLQELITDVAVKRVDFCVGYFNLRGWNLVVNQIDQIPGEYVDENDKQEFRRCRLLIGMHQPDEELVRQLYSTHQIPEGELTIHQLSNYTKNPLLVRVFHELHWVEDLGSGVRNILRYAPLYYPDYNIEINSGQQFLFSITYADTPVDGQKTEKTQDVLHLALFFITLHPRKVIISISFVV